MKWINAEQKVTVTIYDEEHEEHLEEIMTVETMLDAYTNEGCPTIYSEPERKKGKWIDEKINSYTLRTYCSECGNSAPFICVSGDCDYYGRNMHGKLNKTKFCPNCGAEMEE